MSCIPWHACWLNSGAEQILLAMIGTFLRIERNSSTTKLAFASMKEKIFELKTLKYTDKQIKNTIRYLANKHPFSPLWYTTAMSLP